MVDQQAWEPSTGWFVILAFAAVGFVGTYFTGQMLVMIGVMALGIFMVAAQYGQKL
jgi:hypothetical protein